MEHLRLSPLISEDEIKTRVTKLGAIITDKFKGKDLVVVGVLKGSFMFYADLIRAIDTDLTCDFCGVSSYTGMHSSGEVKVNLDLSRSIRDRHVVLVEDIVDTGLTMNFLRKHLMNHKPKSLVTATLLMKPDALKEECTVDLVGFKIPNDFVVGYGLDYQGYFRNLPYIAQVSNIN
ncbi:MAG: hypoxanthine phosphoribosyltransferase [Bdellovibrionaceae bacterium]|nr:hypoxanthine phosphoribosyltransferase [Pseudobdellovibrionaceae bacterium]